MKEIELKPNGKDIEVTQENKKEYIKLVIKHKLTNKIVRQLREILKCFHDLLPYVCGFNSNSPQILYFWYMILDMSNEQRAQLLQFATGTNLLPPGGFMNLMGSMGRRKFTIYRSTKGTQYLSNELDLHYVKSYPLSSVGDPTTKHIRPPPTPTSGLQPSRFSEPCFALSMLRRSNALDRQIVTNGRIVVIGSSDTGISVLERLAFAKSRFFSSFTLVSPQYIPCLQPTIIPPPAFHHQPFVEPYPNGMSIMDVTKQIKLKQLQKDQPDAEFDEDFEKSQYG
ncbi:MAG: putative E3 ubiquitin-protein ligase Itchy, partial [Streblomastix strix]